jgi:tetratricopeptide (TPR) repeat protein
MIPRIQHVGIFAFTTLAVTAAFWGTAPATAAHFSAGQEPPAAGSPSTGETRPTEITLEQRADVLMARKNYAGAIAYYDKALKESGSNNPAVWNKMGIAYQQMNAFSSARKDFRNAVHADKNFAEAWNNIGTVYFMEKRYGKSVSYYRRAIKLKGDVASFHINLGSSYLKLKKWDQAGEEYRAALSIDPTVLSPDSSVGTVVHAGLADVDYYFYMAKALASKGNAEVAVRYLRRALEDGFSGREQIESDPDFQKISKYPAYVELMRNPPVAIKK